MAGQFLELSMLQNRFHVKSELQKYPEISTPCAWGNLQCGIVRIFLPLRFYVKSISMKGFRNSKSVILTVLHRLNLEFGKIAKESSFKTSTFSKVDFT